MTNVNFNKIEKACFPFDRLSSIILTDLAKRDSLVNEMYKNTENAFGLLKHTVFSADEDTTVFANKVFEHKSNWEIVDKNALHEDAIIAKKELYTLFFFLYEQYRVDSEMVEEEFKKAIERLDYVIEVCC